MTGPVEFVIPAEDRVCQLYSAFAVFHSIHIFVFNLIEYASALSGSDDILVDQAVFDIQLELNF